MKYIAVFDIPDGYSMGCALVNYHGSFTPIINADGTPRIWEGEK